MFFLSIIVETRFHEDRERNTFGVLVKGRYKAVSNFTFTLRNNVICESRPHLSGYLLEVCPSSDTKQSKRYEVNSMLAVGYNSACM